MDTGTKTEILNSGAGAGFKILALFFFVSQISVVIMLLLIGKEKKSAVQEKESDKNIPVVVYELSPGRLVDTMEVPGIVKSWSTIKISAEVNGRINFIGFEKGNKLLAGQLLMKIDDRTYLSEKNKCEASLKFSRQNYERNSKLFAGKSISEKELEDAKNMLEEKQAEFEIASTDLDRCEIRSPVDGYLDDRPVELGEYVQIGTRIATIEQIDKVKVVFSIPEKDIPYVRTDETVQFILDCYPGKKFSGKIIFIARSADMNSLSYRTELEVDNKELFLRPGMITRIRLQKNTVENALLVPLIAVIPKYEGHYVFVVDKKENRAKLREIKIGLISGKNALVLSGLLFGEQIVVEGQRLLNENDPLLIVRKETAK